MRSSFILVLLLLFFSLPSFSQSTTEDVIYLKNGSIYRGTIKEQIPNVSFTIEILGGSVVVIQASDILKVTKEAKASTDTTHHSQQSQSYTQEEWQNEHSRSGYRPHRQKFNSLPGYKDKGGFFEAQLNLQYAGVGIRVVGGYKFNQFAMLGAGIGMGGNYAGANGHSLGNDPSPYSGQYFPIFLYFGGDVLKKDITPFYFIEAGYAMATNLFQDFTSDPYNGSPVNTTKGGPMADVGFGMRVYSGRKFVLTLAADLNIQYARTDISYSSYYSYSYPTQADVYGKMIMLMPGLKLGVGFIK